MKSKKSQISDFLDWKQTYQALSATHRFVLFGLLGLEVLSYADFLLMTASRSGFTLLASVFQVTHNPVLAILIDFPIRLVSLYLAFWFLKKGLENFDKFAIVLCIATVIFSAFL